MLGWSRRLAWLEHSGGGGGVGGAGFSVTVQVARTVTSTGSQTGASGGFLARNSLTCMLNGFSGCCGETSMAVAGGGGRAGNDEAGSRSGSPR